MAATINLNGKDYPLERAKNPDGSWSKDQYYRPKLGAGEFTIKGVDLSGLLNQRGIDATLTGTSTFSICGSRFANFTNNQAGLHDDAILIAGSVATLVLSDITFSALGNGVMPIHAVNDFQAGVVVLDHITTANCVHPIHIGGQLPVGKLIIRNCPGIRVIVGKQLVPPPVVQWEGDNTGANVYGQTPPDSLADLRAQLAAAQRDAEKYKQAWEGSQAALASEIEVLNQKDAQLAAKDKAIADATAQREMIEYSIREAVKLLSGALG
jgi:hypothetical protein